ncbi:MAG: hypothetical protein HY040_08555 [Planctomycetes bacterium]|nr:hypothetical protein [Planctomycetota bacterium]
MKRDFLLRDLAQRIHDIEIEEHHLHQAANPLAVPGLEEVLPDGQLPAGAIVEFLSAHEGAGAWTLALIMARQACGEHKVLVVHDGQKCFYPPAASQLGIDLRRAIVIRPHRQAQALAALVQSLRCPAVGATIGAFDGLAAVPFRRLQLAAETGGGISFLMRPASVLRQPSFAAVRLLVTPWRAGSVSDRRTPRSNTPVAYGSPLNDVRCVRIEIVRFRGAKAGRSFLVEIDDEKGDVHLSARLAAAKTLARSARASG